MKIKLSKIMAAVTALGVTFAGFTALAADVAITTSYDYAGSSDVTVNTVISNFADADEGKEVTYYVSTTEEGVANEGILYIDQQTIENKKVEFKFSGVAQDALYNTKVTAKNGSDITGWSVNDYTFKFNPGANYISNASAEVYTTGDFIPYNGLSQGQGYDYSKTEDATGLTAYCFVGKVVGNPTEYGITVDGVDYRAFGCDEAGNFVIMIQFDNAPASDITYSGYTVKE